MKPHANVEEIIQDNRFSLAHASSLAPDTFRSFPEHECWMNDCVDESSAAKHSRDIQATASSLSN